jgi:hypothetical protein
MSDSRLLRCPFCGCEMRLEEDFYGPYHFWYVKHKDYVAFVEDCPLFSTSADTEEEAIAKWNRRAE